MTLHDLKLRVQALISWRRVERELDEELAFHIERDTQRHIASGLSGAEARNRTLRTGAPCRRPVSRRSRYRPHRRLGA
jgi:hypothetical protein